MKDSNFRGYDINCWKMKEKIWNMCNCNRTTEVKLRLNKILVATNVGLQESSRKEDN
jgi:hypothetical protein